MPTVYACGLDASLDPPTERIVLTHSCSLCWDGDVPGREWDPDEAPGNIATRETLSNEILLEGRWEQVQTEHWNRAGTINTTINTNPFAAFDDDPDPDNVFEEEESDYDDDECYADGSPRAPMSQTASVAQWTRDLLGGEVPIMLVPDVRREVSCEWEGTSGVQTAVECLRQLDDIGADMEYHGDCTCDGELVFGRLRLWERDVARSYGRSLAALVKLREEGMVRVGMAAGHHIHVSARDVNERGFSPNNLVSLYSVFAHCEDLLYRLAAAGWTKHRSEADGSYSNPMRKLGASEARTPRSVGLAIGGDRYQGLNVTPYLSQIQNCRCGAYRFGEWQSCECDDSGATIEWRLWNAAVSPRKIRAYIAISAVLTEYASQVDTRDVIGLKEHPFRGTGDVRTAALAAQLDYLTSRPGFSDRDREDIYWLASFAPGMGSLGRNYEDSRALLSTYDEESPSTVPAYA